MKLSKLSSEVYDNALRAVHSGSSKMANDAILKLKLVAKEEELATEELISSRLDNKAVISLRLALESLEKNRRVFFRYMRDCRKHDGRLPSIEEPGPVYCLDISFFSEAEKLPVTFRIVVDVIQVCIGSELLVAPLTKLKSFGGRLSV